MPKAAAAIKPVKARPLSAMADDLWARREERYKLQRQVEQMKKEETKLEETLTKALADSKDTTGIAGKLARVQLVIKEKVVAEDWDRIWKYIFKNNADFLVQRRLSDTAVKEIWESGKTIPGVNKMKFNDLSISKL